MNQTATVREISVEPELRILPLDRVRAAWEDLAASHPAATLYHRRPWLEVLRRAFGVDPSVAIIGEYKSTLAACLLAPGGNPLRRSLISLPFSDFCPPLAVDDSALDSLMSGLSGLAAQSRLEIRGVAASDPWHVLDHFQRWTLDLSRPFQAIERAADREVRRHLRRARTAGVTVECSRSVDAIETFFRLQLESRRRLGVPSQPLKFFRLVHEVFAKLDAIEVWFASHLGKPVAAVVVLRDGDDLHAKWSARVAGSPDGASHSIFMSIVEQHAQRACSLDFGRTDSRNRGLSRFKRELGAAPAEMPYSYFPQMPSVTSAENLTGVWRTASRAWRHLPLPIARVLSDVTYRYLA
ncbi:GNAT family N-acetyltransferase [Candidatus Binatus sp.]|uniref:GNAT family N-acetyltransferase n=1 Tax=Candidatus Binatus sp. TaxID=2811406 RepID=UPI003CBC32BA